MTDLEKWQITWRDSAELAERFRGLLTDALLGLAEGAFKREVKRTLDETSAQSAVDRKVLADNPTLGVRPNERP